MPADDEAELGKRVASRLSCARPRWLSRMMCWMPAALISSRARLSLFDTVETGVGIRARDGCHLRQRDAEQGEGHVVDDALVPGAACVKQPRQSLQPQRGIGGS